MNKSEKVTYEIDPNNRLVITKAGKAGSVPGFRRVIDGKFVLDNKNTLTYKVLSPPAKDTPDQIKLSGMFSLDSEHNIVISLDKWNNQVESNSLTIKGSIIDVSDNELAFSAATRDSKGNDRAYILKLSGAWRADERNRLLFSATKQGRRPDELVFTGAWEINKFNQLIYTYAAAALKRKDRTTNTLTFKGRWDINEKLRLSYILNERIGSRFDFEVSASRPLSRGLEYEIGIGAMPRERRFKLFGGWKINKRLGLVFEMPTEKGRVNFITFGAECKPIDGLSINFKLKNSLGKDLGLDLELSKSIFKNQGQAFLRASKSSKGFSIMAGTGVRW